MNPKLFLLSADISCFIPTLKSCFEAVHHAPESGA